MKTIIMGLIVSLITTAVLAQHENVMVTSFETSNHKVYEKSAANSNYINAALEKTVAKRIATLEDIVANYDIKQESIYSPNKKTTYTVDFKQNSDHIKAIYDQEGLIIKTEEAYNNVRMPYSISGKLAQNYPGWSFENVKCLITYSNGDKRIAYHVELAKGRDSKLVELIH
ncbi:hypothetical protein ESY86_10850 [Subsaximicrobium wynnwilliamsii]|uniref:Nicotinate-nucleotide adenylyltransferase n=1 Tax=Subsaximicrobium wynnwilliamsii TaxID=291179 RepID=A0A5C6ZGV3_9FLAO|nr:hypothetical protein [Subsaximicrobium wynnwilliamsii]TXD84061.1 hypothetical protein ESY87_05990 [Subsaximicrobium wynnwilliamsii]TXD88981.1 hypothetical protein ESY86_10850 [Subsaximicrobium wynnwilliamsii]TXE03773.1 hypothetical protein ESY88_05985 [Subsaximicrobium wynnwilliamsii]